MPENSGHPTRKPPGSKKKKKQHGAEEKEKTQQLHWPMNQILLLNRICTSNLCVTGVQSHKLQAGFNGLG